MVNGVLTGPWVMTELVDRFLFIASILPEEVYCHSRGKLKIKSKKFKSFATTAIAVAFIK